MNLVAFLIAKGVPERFAKPLLYAAALLALAGLLWGAVALHDRHVIATHDQTANVKVIAKVAPANDHAADQRSTDAITNARQAQETHDVIHAAPDQAPAPSSLALGCLRLQRQGKSLAGIPACARFAGGH
jgi:hypothetical protein